MATKAAENSRRFRKNHPSYDKWYRDANPEKIKLHNKRKHEQCKQILHRLKINGCAICGYNKCDAALDFHHSNPIHKTFPINSNAPKKYSNDELTKEINKCILLCNRCHKEIENVTSNQIR